MRILSLDVTGYRSLREIHWEPGRLNVVIGPNGTGKSNLLRFLEFVGVAARGGLSKHIQGLGGMEPLLWDGRAERLAIELKMSPSDDWRDEIKDSLTYKLCLDRIGEGTSYRVGHELLGNYSRVERGETPEPFKLIERRPGHARVFDSEEHFLTAPEERVPEDETLLSLAAGPFTANPLIPLYQHNLASWAVYHDFHVNLDAPVRFPVVSRLERRVAADGQNLVNVLHTLYSGDRDFKAEVNQAMRAAFVEEFEELIFFPAADQRIQMRVQWRSLRRQQPAADLSDGTLRFLFLLAILASPDAAPVIAIDEPETGLHPAMMPIVAEYAAEASRRAQVILTTHSPALLDAFGDARPVTTVALWENGETTLAPLRDEVLEQWRKEYALGKLLTSGELEQLAGQSR